MAENDSTSVPTTDDIEAVSNRLEDAAYSILAVYEIATFADENRDARFLIRGIRDLARTAFKGIDACIQRLDGGNLRIGNFSTEFDNE
ncbi:MAG: hypothetical protein ACRETC_08600 [Gammaproteobacteria bacterium]